MKDTLEMLLNHVHRIDERLDNGKDISQDLEDIHDIVYDLEQGWEDLLKDNSP